MSWTPEPWRRHLEPPPQRNQYSPPRPTPKINPQELRVLRLLGSGDSNLRIAKKLQITDHTVKVHLRNIFQKLGVHNRTQAAIWYLNAERISSFR
jgi:LuxR family transcriptional regulator, positive regulator of biofilm formation